MGRINKQQMDPLYHSRGFQDTIQVNSPSFVSSGKSIFLPVTMRNHRSSPEMGSGKGTRSGNSRFLFPAISCRKKERKVTSSNRFSLLNQYIRKQPFKMETDKSVRQSILVNDWTVSIDLTDASTPTCFDSPSIQKVSSVPVRRSGLPIHSLTFRNVPKTVDFHQTNGRNSSTLVSTCHLVISVPRQLAYKRSNSQQTLTQYIAFKLCKVYCSFQM